VLILTAVGHHSFADFGLPHRRDAWLQRRPTQKLG